MKCQAIVALVIASVLVLGVDRTHAQPQMTASAIANSGSNAASLATSIAGGGPFTVVGGTP
jgi:hypothetical protein